MAAGTGLPTPGNSLGGTFTPGGFVPNKPTVIAPPNQAPYRPGLSPTQTATKRAAASGAVKVKPAGEQHAQKSAQTMATQRMLNAHGAHLTVDGVWGPQTDAAYRAYLYTAQKAREQSVKIDASANPISAPLTNVPSPQTVEAQVKAERAAALSRLQSFHPTLEAAPTTGDAQARAQHEAQLTFLSQRAAQLEQTAPNSPQWKVAVQAVSDYATNMGLTTPAPVTTTPFTSILGGEPAGQEAAGQQALSQYYQTNNPVGQQILSGVAGSLPGVGLVSRVAKGQHISTGNVVGEVVNDALWLTPGQVTEGVSKLISATTGGAADAAVVEEAARTAAARPLTGAIKDEISHAVYSTPNISADQAQAALHLFDTAAYAEAARQGVDPNVMLQRIWTGAKYSADHPELRGDIPEAVHTQMDEMHNIPSEKQARNIRAKAKPTPENMLPQHDVVSTSGQRMLGRVTPEEWVQRLQATTPDIGQQKIDASFYDRLEPLFQKTFGDGYMPVLKAFAASQANAGTKEGLASVLRAAERIERGAPVVGEEGGVGSVVADAIERAYKGEILTKGQAAKLSDFIDSIRQLKTREWMAHNPQGLEPAAGDVWSARDAGYLDKKLVGEGTRGRAASTHKFIQAQHGVNLRDFKPDIPGAPKGSRYEHINQFYHDVRDHLNAIAYHGRTDWTAAQAQAMGWANIQRFYGRDVRDVNDWVDAGIRQAKQGLRRDQAREADRHINSFGKSLHVLDRKTAMGMEPDARFLYHGTDDSGLRGILSEGKIRAMPTERNPEDVRAWLTDHPARAGAQGGHVLAIPKSNIPDDLLSHHPLGMHSSPTDVPIFGAADDSRVAMVHSEAEPYPDLHPAEAKAYAKLTPAQKTAYAQATDRAVQGSSFKSVLGLEDKGSHFGVGVWRGVENPGAASKVVAPTELTPEFVRKMDALAAAEGMAKEQGSVSWGRPLPADAPTGFKATLLRQPPTGALGAAVDKAYGEGLVGVIHGPENSTYLVDFGGKADLSQFGGQPIRWEGGYVHDERLTEMASPDAQTFQQAIDAVPEAPALKNAVEHTNAVVKNIQTHFFGATGREAQGTLNELYRSVFEQAGGKVGPRGMTQSDIAATENYLHDIAAKHPDDPTVKQFLDLYEAAGDARNATDPEFLFADSKGLFGSMERAHGTTQLLRQDVKGAVVRFEDDTHKLLLTSKSDSSTVVHELVHAMMPYLGHVGTDEEAVARSFEAYVMEGHAPTPALQPTFDTLSKALRSVYGDASRIPENALTPELRAEFDRFLSSESKVKYTQVGENPDEKTLWHNGQTPTIAQARKYIDEGHTDAESFHLHAHDENGTLVGAAHGYARPDEVHLTSIRVNPDHEGRGIGGEMMDRIRNAAGDRRLSADFLDPRLQAREEAKSLEAGRNVYTKRTTGRTLFQKDDASHWTEDAVKLADEHGVDIADVKASGEGGRVTKADVENHVFQTMAPEKQLRSTLQGLKIGRGKQDALYSEERSARFGVVRGTAAREDLSSREKLIASKGALAGELPKIIVGGTARSMTPETLEALGQQVWAHPNLMEGQKVRVVDALEALVDHGKMPTHGELSLMGHVWGKETVASVREAAGKWKSFLSTLLNTPRALETTFNFSAPVRHGLAAGVTHPIIFGKDYAQMFKMAASQDYLDRTFAEIGTRPTFPMMEQAHLALTHLGSLTNFEEGFARNFAEKIPGLGRLVKASNRAYTGFLVKLRADIFDHLLKVHAAAGVDVHDEQYLEGLGRYVNIITGRGKLSGLEPAANALNAVFFSPRLVSSRLALLNPAWYAGLPAPLRIEALKTALALAGTISGVATVASFLPGVTVNTDPRDADWGKIKIGNTRIDIAGGFQQPLRLAAQLYTGVEVSSTTGRAESLTSGGYGKPTRPDILVKFIEGKLAPTVGGGLDILGGKNAVGQPLTASSEAWSKLAPIVAQDAYTLYKEQHGGVNGVAAAFGGVLAENFVSGMQTYGPTVPGASGLQKEMAKAKAVGVTIPKSAQAAIQHESALKGITSADQGNPTQRMKDSIAYYKQVTGRNDFDRYTKVTDGATQNAIVAIIRARLDAGASGWETSIKARTAAGVK